MDTRGREGGPPDATARNSPEEHGESVRMHRLFLHIEPKYAEELYYGQLEGLDLVNCLIAPLFFANTLAMWTRGLLSAVYCAVLLLKGYQMGLLLLPGARQVHAHRKARYWLILGERLLRQFVATPLLGRGPRFLDWMRQSKAESNTLLFCARLLLLLSGFTISFWNAFCLPLGFVSQVVVNTLFVFIHYPATGPHVAYAFEMLVQKVPYLLLLQHGLERTVGRVYQLLQPMMTVVAAVLSRTEYQQGSCTVQGSSTESCAAGWAPAAAGRVFSMDQLLVKPSKCPDTATLTGRYILAMTTAYVIFAVWLLPLYAVWRLERHLKSKWMATLPRPQQPEAQLEQQEQTQQQQTPQAQQQEAAAEVLKDQPDSIPEPTKPTGGLLNRLQRLRQAAMKRVAALSRLCQVKSGSSKDYIHPPVVFTVCPDRDVLARHVGVLFLISLMLGELFVVVYMNVPAVQAVMWEQVV